MRPGELLVSWAATLGAYFWNGPEAVLNQHIFKVESTIDQRFHKYLLDYKLSELQRHAHGSGMVHITRGRFDSVAVLLPDLTEQRRIVDILEDHLSRLGAADASLATVLKRSRSLEQRILASVHGASFETAALNAVADIQGGIQKQQKRQPRNNAYPFLRVANVSRGGLDLREVHDVELFGGELDRYRLVAGDLLVVEGNGSASQIGRAAIWDGSIEDCVHQNHLIRVRPRRGLIPEFLEAVWNSPQNRRRLTDLSSSSSGLHTLSVGKLKTLGVPLRSLDEQREFVERVERFRDSRARLDTEVARARSRSTSLRRALLAAAFSGKLTGATSDSERIEELSDER